MFVCYFVGISFQAVVAVLGWFGTVSKRNTMIIGIMSFVAGFSTCIAAVVSTVLYCVFMTVFQSAPEFNIRANLGEPMFVCVWMAAGCALVSTLINLAACCCCCCCGRGRKAKRDDEKRRVLEMDQERE